MSALPPKADKQQTCRYVRFVPKRTYAAQQTAVYSITSSAVASSVGGTVRPSALAVLRLITNWNFVGA